MSLLSKMQLAAMSDIDTRIVYMCRQGRESPDANFSKIETAYGSRPFLFMRNALHASTIYVHRTSLSSTCIRSTRRPPVSPVRFLSVRSSDGYTSGTHELLHFIPTLSFRYFLPSGIYTGKIAAVNI